MMVCRASSRVRPTPRAFSHANLTSSIGPYTGANTCYRTPLRSDRPAGHSLYRCCPTCARALFPIGCYQPGAGRAWTKAARAGGGPANAPLRGPGSSSGTLETDRGTPVPHPDYHAGVGFKRRSRQITASPERALPLGSACRIVLIPDRAHPGSRLIRHAHRRRARHPLELARSCTLWSLRALVVFFTPLPAWLLAQAGSQSSFYLTDAFRLPVSSSTIGNMEPAALVLLNREGVWLENRKLRFLPRPDPEERYNPCCTQGPAATGSTQFCSVRGDEGRTQSARR